MTSDTCAGVHRPLTWTAPVQFPEDGRGGWWLLDAGFPRDSGAARRSARPRWAAW